MNLFQKLNRFPPCLLRLLARNADGEAKPLDEIIREMTLLSGRPMVSVAHTLSYTTSWDEVTVGNMQLWLAATGCDLEDRATYRRLSRYMNPDRDTKFSHLRRSDEWPELKRILTVYLESLQCQ